MQHASAVGVCWVSLGVTGASHLRRRLAPPRPARRRKDTEESVTVYQSPDEERE